MFCSVLCYNITVMIGHGVSYYLENKILSFVAILYIFHTRYSLSTEKTIKACIEELEIVVKC